MADMAGETPVAVRRRAQRPARTQALVLRLGAVTAWLTVAVSAWFGDLILPALLSDEQAARTTATAALWAAYLLVLAALMSPGPRAMTIVRIAMPAGALELWIAAARSSHSLDAAALIGLIGSLLGTGVVLLPLYGEAHADAASYGDERRFLLRPPGPVLVTLVLPMWAMTVAGVAAGPVLLADRGWVAGTVAAVVGLPVAAFSAHALSRLSRRWLVFVPNGLVVHDHMALAEPLPLSRRSVTSIGPARSDTSATDLTTAAFGIALELRLSEPAKAAVTTGRNRHTERPVSALLVAPSRPAAVLEAAERRRLQIS